MKYYYKEVKEENNFYHVLGKKPFTREPPIDRSGILDSSIEILSPIPNLSLDKIIFSDEVDNKAKDLLAKSQDENIELRIAWSGGVDSTVILSSIIKNKVDYPRSDIKVCLNQDSIKESPWFYNNYIKNILDVYESNIHNDYKASGNGLADSFSRDTGKDWVLVTGEVADQLNITKLRSERVPMQEKDLTIDTAYESYLNFEHWSDEVRAFIKPLVDAMPEGWTDKQIDVGSWVKYVCDYQWSQVRISLMYGIPYDKIDNFFDTDKFQQWWLQTPPSVRYAGRTEFFYKPEFQDYIKDFCGGAGEMVQSDSLPVTTSVRPRDANTESEGQAVWTSLDVNFNREQRIIPPPVTTSEDVDGTTEVTISNIEIHL